MAINLAQKYSSVVDERFKLQELTKPFVNRDYEWNGVNTITVYSIPTVDLNDYTKTGTSRYGTPKELEDNKQDLSVRMDKGFTFTIDKGNKQDQLNVKDAGKALKREIDEVIIPAIDKYRLKIMTEAALLNNSTDNTTPTKTNAYELFLNGTAYLADKKIPVEKLVAGVTPKFYNLLKLDSSFIKNSDLAYKDLVKGQVGEVDGVKIIKIPQSYFETGTSFIIAHPSATVAVNKLEDYKIHDNPPGISGNLVEGRVRYDAHVLDSKKDAIYVQTTYKPSI